MSGFCRILCQLILWFIAFAIELPMRLFRDRNESSMLISEEGLWARDNGFHLFCFIKKYHPEIKAFYVIKKDSPDRKKIECYADSLIDFQSFKHYRFFWKSKYLVSTHVRGGYTPVRSRMVTKLSFLYHDKRVVDIKHGITKDNVALYQYRNTRLSLMVCGAEPEWKYMVSNYHYPSGVAKLTGFCRWDNLYDCHVRKQIVVMPTWRRYLNEETIINSDYLNTYKGLLESKKLSQLLDAGNIDLIFYPHNCAQPFLHLFYADYPSKHIRVASNKCFDVQALLKESALLITDFSSVFFDFAYMEKPMIFFHFDEESYRKGHFAQGYFDYNQSFGPVVKDIEALVSQISFYMENGFKMETEYKKVVAQYFPLRDQDNCKRVFESIINC